MLNSVTTVLSAIWFVISVTPPLSHILLMALEQLSGNGTAPSAKRPKVFASPQSESYGSSPMYPNHANIP